MAAKQAHKAINHQGICVDEANIKTPFICNNESTKQPIKVTNKMSVHSLSIVDIRYKYKPNKKSHGNKNIPPHHIETDYINQHTNPLYVIINTFSEPFEIFITRKNKPRSIFNYY